MTKQAILDHMFDGWVLWTMFDRPIFIKLSDRKFNVKLSDIMKLVDEGEIVTIFGHGEIEKYIPIIKPLSYPSGTVNYQESLDKLIRGALWE